MEFDISGILGKGADGATANTDAKFTRKRNRDDRYNESNVTQAEKFADNFSKLTKGMRDKITPGFIKRLNDSKIYKQSMEEVER